MEVETRRFYEKAAARTHDASIRQLLDDLATEEREHENRAQELDKQILPANVKADEEVAQRRLFVLQIVQPGLARSEERRVGKEGRWRVGPGVSRRQGRWRVTCHAVVT